MYQRPFKLQNVKPVHFVLQIPMLQALQFYLHGNVWTNWLLAGQLGKPNAMPSIVIHMGSARWPTNANGDAWK